MNPNYSLLPLALFMVSCTSASEKAEQTALTCLNQNGVWTIQSQFTHLEPTTGNPSFSISCLRQAAQLLQTLRTDDVRNIHEEWVTDTYLLPALPAMRQAANAQPASGQTGYWLTVHAKGTDAKGKKAQVVKQMLLNEAMDSVLFVADSTHRQQPCTVPEMVEMVLAEGRYQDELHLPAAQYQAAQQRFYNAFKQQEGVKALEDGLLYRVVERGNGRKPTMNQTVVVNYEGRLSSGKVFDSSYWRHASATFDVEALIPGWAEALTMMPVGSTWQICVPAPLGYGADGYGPVPPNATLVFQVQLLRIQR